MNQESIGKFISKCRKNKKLTQEELAIKLNISKNTVNKWERGICLVDISLLKPLSEILDVSVIELLSGKTIEKSDISSNSENVIIELSKLYISKSNILKSMKIGILGMCITFIILSSIFIFKGISPSSLISIVCAYNTFAYLGKYKFTKNRSDLFIGVLFLNATFVNFLEFLLN